MGQIIVASKSAVTLAGSQTLSNKTLTAPTINGTIATTGLTLPAFTLSGTVAGGAQIINNVSTLLIGSATAWGATAQKLEVNEVTNYGGANLNTWMNDASFASIMGVRKSRGTTPGTHTVVVSGDVLGYFLAAGSDGTDWQDAAYIRIKCTGTQADNRVPGWWEVICQSDIAASAPLVVLSMKADSYIISTSNAAQTAKVDRLSISGALATAQASITDMILTYKTSIDSAAVIDEVTLGAYEISAGHRALAISSEEAVVTEVDETKFSHKLPVRINGATYNIMLCAT